MNFAKIKDTPEFVRDMKTNAVVRLDTRELDEFNQRRRKILEEKKEKEETKLRLAKIEDDMQEIKSLLKEITQIRS
jgi:hypothetical protein